MDEIETAARPSLNRPFPRVTCLFGGAAGSPPKTAHFGSINGTAWFFSAWSLLASAWSLLTFCLARWGRCGRPRAVGSRLPAPRGWGWVALPLLRPRVARCDPQVRTSWNSYK